MTQLTGHGCFNEYLFQVKNVNRLIYVYCDAPINDVMHMLFNYYWYSNWQNVNLGECHRTLGSEDRQVMTNQFVCTVLGKKTEEKTVQQTNNVCGQ